MRFASELMFSVLRFFFILLFTYSIDWYFNQLRFASLNNKTQFWIFFHMVLLHFLYMAEHGDLILSNYAGHCLAWSGLSEYPVKSVSSDYKKNDGESCEDWGALNQLVALFDNCVQTILLPRFGRSFCMSLESWLLQYDNKAKQC